jgi:hypothetical protein
MSFNGSKKERSPFTPFPASVHETSQNASQRFLLTPFVFARTIQLRMPTAGGEADKLGNRYEALWAMDSLLSMVDGRAKDFILEPIDENDARGIEFSLTIDDGTVEHWSIKRQTTRAAGWTLNLLTEKDENRRSILADLSGHLNRDEKNRVVFASTLGTRRLTSSSLYAQTKETLDTRLALAAELRNDFNRYLLPLFDNDQERARIFCFGHAPIQWSRTIRPGSLPLV